MSFHFEFHFWGVACQSRYYITSVQRNNEVKLGRWLLVFLLTASHYFLSTPQCLWRAHLCTFMHIPHVFISPKDCFRATFLEAGGTRFDLLSRPKNGTVLKKKKRHNFKLWNHFENTIWAWKYSICKKGNNKIETYWRYLTIIKKNNKKTIMKPFENVVEDFYVALEVFSEGELTLCVIFVTIIQG